MHQLTFFVAGTPVQQGSKRYLGNRGGKGVMIEQNKAKNDTWRSDVRNEAEKALAEAEFDVFSKPLIMTVSFYFPRPKSHYRTGRHKDQLRPDAPTYKISPPDTDKLLRSVGDSLSGLVYKDDAQLVDLRGVKYYGLPPGARITIHPTEVE